MSAIRDKISNKVLA